MKFYLIDLERSIGTGVVHYWKSNRFGYTRDIKEAGLYEEKVANEIVAGDFDKQTVMVSSKLVENILK